VIPAFSMPASGMVSGYGLWTKEHRQTIVEELKRDPSYAEKSPKEQIGAIARALGQKWTELDVEVKTKYETAAHDENEKMRKEKVSPETVSMPAEAAPARPPKPASEAARLKELQALKQQVSSSVEDMRGVARTFFLQDAAERSRMASEVLGEETVVAKMEEIWSKMPDEQMKNWEARVQAEKVNTWEQSPDGLELKSILERRQMEAKARVQMHGDAAQKARKGGGKGRGRGRGKGRGRGRGRGSVAKPAPAETSATSPSKRRCNDVSRAAAAATPQREPAGAESVSTPQKLAVSHDAAAAVADLRLDEESLKRARRKGLEASLIHLAQRSEIKALQLSGSELFEAIRKSGGLVNAAKNSLLAERQKTTQGVQEVEMLV